MSPSGRAVSSSRQAALKVHGGAWCVLTATATKGKNKHLLQNQFLSKQTDISGKPALCDAVIVTAFRHVFKSIKDLSRCEVLATKHLP